MSSYYYTVDKYVAIAVCQLFLNLSNGRIDDSFFKCNLLSDCSILIEISLYCVSSLQLTIEKDQYK